MKRQETREGYIAQLRGFLKRYNVKNVDDIVEDYEEYFAHSAAKGYSDSESVSRLPSAQELARSYESAVHKESTQSQPVKRRFLFSAAILGELMLLPFIAVTGLFFACIGVAGLLTFAGGVLMLVPAHMLGNIAIPHPPLPLFLPTVSLLTAGGMAVFGATLILAERFYSAVRISILIKRQILTGKHNDYLKLVPPISKRVRRVLYMIVAAAFTVAIIALLTLIVAGTVINGSSTITL